MLQKIGRNSKPQRKHKRKSPRIAPKDSFEAVQSQESASGRATGFDVRSEGMFRVDRQTKPYAPATRKRTYFQKDRVMNYVHALQSVITPLESKRAINSRTVHERFGNELLLPSDYLEFLSTFGQGFFWLKMIEGPRKWAPILYMFDLVEGVPLDMIELFMDIAREAHVETTFFPAAYPSVPGLLLWGGSCEGDTFYWWTEGHPDEWPVVVDDRGRYEILTFRCTFTEFLYGNLTGTDHLYRGRLPEGLIYSPDEPDNDVPQ